MIPWTLAVHKTWGHYIRSESIFNVEDTRKANFLDRFHISLLDKTCFNLVKYFYGSNVKASFQGRPIEERYRWEQEGTTHSILLVRIADEEKPLLHLLMEVMGPMVVMRRKWASLTWKPFQTSPAGTTPEEPLECVASPFTISKKLQIWLALSCYGSVYSEKTHLIFFIFFIARVSKWTINR